ncbi:hypothetical protein P8452_09455 [Trifolium repens]|nr:hypothetical protein P8452_09455 [Trifolium repens]
MYSGYGDLSHVESFSVYGTPIKTIVDDHMIESSTTIKQLKLINKTRARKIIRKVGLKLSKKTRTRKIIRKIGLQLIVPLFNKENTLKQFEKNYGFGCRNAVELGPLAATLMKKPCLRYYGVDELLLVVNGINLGNQKPLSIEFKWDKYEHRKELAKMSTINVYSYHKIGTKLLAQDW